MVNAQTKLEEPGLTDRSNCCDSDVVLCKPSWVRGCVVANRYWKGTCQSYASRTSGEYPLYHCASCGCMHRVFVFCFAKGMTNKTDDLRKVEVKTPQARRYSTFSLARSLGFAVVGHYRTRSTQKGPFFVRLELFGPARTGDLIVREKNTGEGLKFRQNGLLSQREIGEFVRAQIRRR